MNIVQFLLNAGFIVLGLYVAAKVFNVDIGGSNRGSERDGYRQKSASGNALTFMQDGGLKGRT